MTLIFCGLVSRIQYAVPTNLILRLHENMSLSKALTAQDQGSPAAFAARRHVPSPHAEQFSGCKFAILHNFAILRNLQAFIKICQNLPEFGKYVCQLCQTSCRPAASAPSAGPFSRRWLNPRAGSRRRGRRPSESPRGPGRVVASFWQNFGKMLLVFGCIGTDFCKKICVLQHFSKSTRLSS